MYFDLIQMDDIDKYIGRKNTIIVDLRKKEDYERGHVRGAVSVPYPKMDELYRTVLSYDWIILYCYRGGLSLQAARELGKVKGKVLSVVGDAASYCRSRSR